MKNVKLMIVNASNENDKKDIGTVIEVIESMHFANKYYSAHGDFPYSINPIDTDEDLTVRVGAGHDDVLYNLMKVSKAPQRKLLVRAFKMIARHRGWTDAQVRKGGNYASIADWARNWADWYFDYNGQFISTHTNWLHGTEHDPVNGEQWYEFAESEIDSQ